MAAAPASPDDLLDPLSAFLIADQRNGLEEPRGVCGSDGASASMSSFLAAPAPAPSSPNEPTLLTLLPEDEDVDGEGGAEVDSWVLSAASGGGGEAEERIGVHLRDEEEEEGGGGDLGDLGFLTAPVPPNLTVPMPESSGEGMMSPPLQVKKAEKQRHAATTPPPPPSAAPVKLMTGEINLMHLNAWPLVYEDHQGYMWSIDLYVTTYRIIFLPPSKKGPYPPLHHKVFDVPVLSVDRLERDRIGTGRNTIPAKSISISTKDMRFFRVILHPEENFDNVLKTLVFAAFQQQQDFMFCFAHRLGEGPDSGWNVYNPMVEMERLGVLALRPDGTTSPWRVTRLNHNYELCASYPSTIVVPSAVSDLDITILSSFRSEQRIPALSWGRQVDSGSIWRSSQPKVGMQQATCPQDEDMLNCLAHRSRSGKLAIYDCRPRANAMANMAAGYGYELSAVYASSNVSFWDIPNIHAVRSSLQKIEQLSRGKSVPDVKWQSLVEETGWLGHVRAIIQAAWHVAREVHNDGSPVLVHCSHGWDRTSQVVALAQLFLDPYFRTVEGFQVLIEKDWLSFGHPFQLRHGHGVARGQEGRDDQRSPIFVQFLDCVWQLVRLFPSAFEYNSRYLLFIADNIYSCRFGTFLANCELERKQLGLAQRCPSLWTHIRANFSHYTNPFYEWKEVLPVREACRFKFGVLDVPLAVILRGIILWNDYHLRWSTKTSLQGMPEGLRRKLQAAKLPPWSPPPPGLEENADYVVDQVSQCLSDEVEGVVYLAGRECQQLAAELRKAEEEIVRLKHLLEEKNVTPLSDAEIEDGGRNGRISHD